MRKIAILGLASALWCGSASADYLLVTLSQLQEQPNIYREFLRAVGDAYGSANAELEIRQTRSLFCAPRNLVLTGENYVQLLEYYLRKHAEIFKAPNYTVSMVLLDALQDNFPCGK